MKRYLIPLVIAGACISSACTSVGGGVAVREPGVRVGINVSTYPRLSRVPGYPVYYAPGAGWNYFFYEDRYWVFEEDLWYASRGYNGPWDVIDPYYVPSYVLRVPVRYYTRPPSYFRGWRADAPPRWDEHWGATGARAAATGIDGILDRPRLRRHCPRLCAAMRASAIRAHRGCNAPISPRTAVGNSATRAPSNPGYNVATVHARAPSHSRTRAAANRHE